MNELVWLRSLVEDDDPDPLWIDATRRRLEARYARDETLNRALRGVIDSGEPSDIEISTARLALERRIADEKRPPDRMYSRMWGVVAAAVVVAVLFVGAVSVLRPPPLSALDNLAKATEVLPNDTFLGESVVRESNELVLVVSSTSGVSYLQPLHRVRRVAAETVQVTITNGEPIFFTPEDEATHGEWVRLEAKPGIPQTLTATRPGDAVPGLLLHDDTDVLAAKLREYVVSVGDPAVLDDVEILELIGEIYRTILPQPRERAALIRVAASLETAEPVDVAGLDITAVRIEHADRGIKESYTIGFNETGWMVYEEALLLEAAPDIGVPQDTPLSRSTYAVPTSH